MIPRLSSYEEIVGKRKIEEIRETAEPLKDKHIVHVNATSIGGGVAEILNTMVFLMNDAGIKTGWRVILGSHSFFKITKGMHNALQGQRWKMSSERKHLYDEYCRRNSIINHIDEHDIVVVHDPQPLGMIKGYEKKTTWLWRCHIDISRPNREVLDYLLPYVKKYDGVIVSSRKFRIKYLRRPQNIITPSIDPISQKNKKISETKARRLLSKKDIDLDKPILCQISRFDPWKDHLGVIRMYQRIKREHDCQLVLMGDMAGDDPQGPLVYHKIKQKSEEIPGIRILTEKNDLLVNALQKMSHVVFQNSIKEGFALTVSEALWKNTPVIAKGVGGIPLQVKNNKTGFIMKNEKEGVKRAVQLLESARLRQKLGRQGHEHVRENFLITTHLMNYIKLFNRHINSS